MLEQRRGNSNLADDHIRKSGRRALPPLLAQIRKVGLPALFDHTRTQKLTIVVARVSAFVVFKYPQCIATCALSSDHS